MKRKRSLLLALAIAVLAAMNQACNKQPLACFTTSVNSDSIYVNKPVVFNGQCSLHAGEYYWIFYALNDSLIYYNQIDTVTFTDTGVVNIELDVLNGNTTGSTYETIRVKP